MAWHEILAWVVIAVAFIMAAAWCIRRIVFPSSRCKNCDKDCILRR